jgi:hypothetical protein
LARFAPGAYEFDGKTVDGGKLISTAYLSHEFLPAPTFTPSGGEEVSIDNLVVEWNSPGAELVEIILTTDDSDAVFDVIVEGDETSLDIPEQFLESGAEYKIELLAYSENGNRTIAESTFITSTVD